MSEKHPRTRDIWFISDTHFFHGNIIRFCDRPFSSAEEMNEVLIDNWNSVVKPQDHVWHLGDFALGFEGDHKRVENIVRRLNGHLRLVVGNHDNIRALSQITRFEKIELWRGFKDQDFTCVHIPLPLAALRDGSFCVHGHIHQNLLDDPHYINVCVEHTGYKPVNLDEIIARIKNT